MEINLVNNKFDFSSKLYLDEFYHHHLQITIYKLVAQIVDNIEGKVRQIYNLTLKIYLPQFRE